MQNVPSVGSSVARSGWIRGAAGTHTQTKYCNPRACMPRVKNGLLDKPACIFNVDETGMQLQHKREKAVAKKGARNVAAHTSGDKMSTIFIACGNAAGQPMVLFRGKS